MFRFLCWISRKTNPDFDEVIPHAKIMPNPYYDRKNIDIINKSKVGDTVHLTYLCEDGKIISQETIVKENDRSILIKQLGQQNKIKINESIEAEILEDNDTDDSSSIDLSFYNHYRFRRIEEEIEEEHDKWSVPDYIEDNRI